MMTFLIVLHVIICILLIILILIQAGRGGGLVEGFSSVESMFGPKTNTFLTRSTGILSTLFIITCVSLALLSARQSRSLMKNVGVQETHQKTAGTAAQAVPTPQTTTTTATAPSAAEPAPASSPAK